AEAIGYAVYESDWSSNYLPGLSNALLTIIIKAQNPFKFSAGGLVNINVRILIT
ncbi:hypothetical protein ILUMI_20146, partial [Ignelater luminosus]